MSIVIDYFCRHGDNPSIDFQSLDATLVIETVLASLVGINAKLDSGKPADKGPSLMITDVGHFKFTRDAHCIQLFAADDYGNRQMKGIGEQLSESGHFNRLYSGIEADDLDDTTWFTPFPSKR